MRPRRQLVDQQPAVARPRRTRCRECRRTRAPPSPLRDASTASAAIAAGTCGRRDRHVEDVMPVHVLNRPEVEDDPSTPRAPITEISRSRSMSFSSTASRRPRLASALGSSSRLDDRLALAVVAERGRLQHGRAPESSARRRQISVAPDWRKRRHRQARAPCRNVFSRMRCCAISSARPLRPDDRLLLGGAAAARATRSRTRTSRRRRRARTRGSDRGRRTTPGPRRRRSVRSGVSCSGASVWTR